MRKLLVLLIIIFLVSCGYTTRGFLYDGYKIKIKPVENKINITSEDRKYSGYTSFPILIENRLTNEIVTKFNIDGGLKVVNEDPEALSLTCTVDDYKKETVRYTDNDDVEEQRLRLYVNIILVDSSGKELIKKTVVGESTYFINRASEESAQIELIDDAARRIVEAVAEAW
ncbi:MAG: hypothetical protein JW867_01510 [Candidatus Omnitrophica bacterium]|nr:hypothetical protein [Candidatus Omnitrophota bacterium]